MSVVADRPDAAPLTSRAAIVLYDRDCGFCRWSLRRLLALDRDHHLRAVALQDAEADRLLGDLDVAERMSSWHLIDARGRRSSAGRALAPLLRELRGGGPLARLLESSPAVADAGYGVVARHRSSLGRIVRLLSRE